jgi:hypothetical protein
MALIFSAILAGFFKAVQDTIAHHAERTWLADVIRWAWFWTCEGQEVRFLWFFKWKLDGWHFANVASWMAAAWGVSTVHKYRRVWVAVLWFLGMFLTFHIFYNVIFL